MERENQPSARGWRRRRSAVGRWSAGRLGAGQHLAGDLQLGWMRLLSSVHCSVVLVAIWPQSGNHRPIEENFQEFLVVRAELLPFLCFPWCDYTMFCRFADNITLLGMIVASLAG
ncbi:uncharacterized protein [Lolium perenne]|uniref:uncharacterized protein n=1 Tax=Lolium perenne TaxID=4522 RepID=UPI0021F62B8F|nr:uncharacterized protein LOC127308561 isoform X2 [Lolium perenne]